MVALRFSLTYRDILINNSLKTPMISFIKLSNKNSKDYFKIPKGYCTLSLTYRSILNNKSVQLLIISL